MQVCIRIPASIWDIKARAWNGSSSTAPSLCVSGTPLQDGAALLPVVLQAHHSQHQIYALWSDKRQASKYAFRQVRASRRAYDAFLSLTSEMDDRAMHRFIRAHQWWLKVCPMVSLESSPQPFDKYPSVLQNASLPADQRDSEEERMHSLTGHPAESDRSSSTKLSKVQRGTG